MIPMVFLPLHETTCRDNSTVYSDIDEDLSNSVQPKVATVMSVTLSCDNRSVIQLTLENKEANIGLEQSDRSRCSCSSSPKIPKLRRKSRADVLIYSHYY